MGRRVDLDWERLACTDPYWAVLTAPRFRGASIAQADRDEFFTSGERHIADVFATCEDLVGQTLVPQRALDFGCGVGRMLPSLARRCESVVGADISPRMIELARAHCARLVIGNTDVVLLDDDLNGLAGEFDFVHSLIVFQHISPPYGERVVARLCAGLLPGGLAVLQFPTATRESPPARAVAALRDVFRPLHSGLNLLSGRPSGTALMRMHLYSLPRLRGIIGKLSCTILHESAFSDGAYDGVLLWIRRDRVPT